MDKIEQIKKLVQELNKASALYYNGRQSDLTDKEWDLKFDELKQLEQETNFTLNSSPTQNVGSEVVSMLEKVKHTKPMLSLDKTKNIDELQKFLGNQEGVLSWKEDGLTIVLTYENSILIDAITRGGGDIGSRILHNAKVFKNIPQKISYDGKLIIRGEGLISREDFEIININKEYANPRNLASGSIMQLDSNIAKQRNLQFKCFSIAECNKEFKLYTEQLEWLKSLGFDTVEYNIVKNDNLKQTIEHFKNSIGDYQFATDGLVLMYNDLKFGESLGSTSHHENNAMALKWEDSTKETVLKDIQFQVGRTGVLTPIAIFDEVELEQTIVNKSSLHNISILKSLELGIGDIITVYKANMIIPQIDENLTRSNTFVLPTKCPICGDNVEIKTSEQAEFLYCTNPYCNAKLSQKVKHYCSKTAMNIDGFSIKSIEKFIDKGFIKDIPDIYKLDQYKKEIINMEGFGLKSYNKLIESINNSKECSLSNFILGLGIPNVGKKTAKDLANYFKTIDNLKAYTKEQLIKIDDIGDTTADSIIQWLNNDKNKQLLDELLQRTTFKEEKKIEIKTENTNNLLYGKHVYCTGKFSLKKNELKAKLSEIGCIFESGYKKSLDYLILGGDTCKSGKADKAMKDGVKMMSEEEMLKYLN